MRSFLIVLAVLGVAVARPGYLGLGRDARGLLHVPVAAPLAHSTIAAPAPVVASVVAPHAVSSQHLANRALVRGW